jgi:hypothetical protein
MGKYGKHMITCINGGISIATFNYTGGFALCLFQFLQQMLEWKAETTAHDSYNMVLNTGCLWFKSYC